MSDDERSDARVKEELEKYLSKKIWILFTAFLWVNGFLLIVLGNELRIHTGIESFGLLCLPCMIWAPIMTVTLFMFPKGVD